MRRYWLFFILVFLSMTLFGVKLADLPDVIKPFQLMVDGDRIYIPTFKTVYMFSMKDFKSLGQFGKRGEGPGEFKFVPMLKVYPDCLTIWSRGKFMFFSRDGVYQSEKKIPTRLSRISRLEELWVGKENKPDEKGEVYFETVNIYDNDFKMVKTLYNEKSENVRGFGSGKIDWPAIMEYSDFCVYDRHIYIGDSAKGFFFEVFDDQGNKLYQIDKKYEKMKVTDKFKAAFMKDNKNNKLFERMKGRLNIVFPEYFPPFAGFRIRDGRIYVFTHIKKDKKKETIILDLKGNEFHRVYLPADYISCIYKDNYYFLVENDVEEMWEIHMVPIK